MKLPNILEFLDIKGPRESIGEPMVIEMNKDRLGPKEVFLSWEHLTTAQDKRGLDKRYIRAFTIIGIFVGVLLLIMQEFFVILIIVSLIFFTQAVLKMKPEAIKYEVSNHGISVGDTLYYWDKLVRFFFSVRENSEVLAIDTTLGFPGRIFVPFEITSKDKIKEILERYLHFLESEPKTFLDNAYDRVVKKFSFEEPGLEESSKEVKQKE